MKRFPTGRAPAELSDKYHGSRICKLPSGISHEADPVRIRSGRLFLSFIAAIPAFGVITGFKNFLAVAVEYRKEVVFQRPVDDNQDCPIAAPETGIVQTGVINVRG